MNAVLGYITVITLCFTVTDPTAVLTSATGYPFIQHFFNVTNSYAAVNILTAIIIITLVSAVISEVATASRQIWSFARDSGLPFSPFLKQVSITLSTYPSNHSYQAGQPWLERPLERSLGLVRLRRCDLPHQHRLHRCFERYHFPHHLRPPRVLHRIHWLFPLKTSAQRTSTTSQVLARKMGHVYQYHRPDLPDLLLHFLFLPHCETSHSADNELEYCYVWWYYGLCYHLLYNHWA